MIKKVNNNFEELALGNNKLTLVDFYADWCGPCRAQTPILEELSNNHDWFEVVSLDVDDNNEIAFKYGVQSIPTLIIFKDGNPVKKVVGLTNDKELLKILEENK